MPSTATRNAPGTCSLVTSRESGPAGITRIAQATVVVAIRNSTERRTSASRRGRILVDEVVAQERLDDPEADDDADEDHERGERLDDAVAARRDPARVDRQQQHRQQLLEDARDLVGAERTQQAFEVSGHLRRSVVSAGA